MARRRAQQTFVVDAERMPGHFPVTARKLVTVEGALWQEPDELPKGCIVRIKPPRKATREEVQATRERFLQAGAAAVRVVARAQEAVVVNTYNELAPAQSIREVVGKMAEEANTQDRDALVGALERAMGKAGL